jgi:hypothetical protein
MVDAYEALYEGLLDGDRTVRVPPLAAQATIISPVARALEQR